MGNFYVNYTLRGVTPPAVAAALVGRRAIVTPLGGDVGDSLVVFDKASDSQKEAVIAALAGKLSGELKCPLLAVLNHDDDILCCNLYTMGKLADEYNSCPDYFTFSGIGKPKGPTGGDAAKLCGAFGSQRIADVEKILRKPGGSESGYIFELQRHADLVEALGLPAFAVGGSYKNFEARELPEGLSDADVIHTK